MFFPFVVAGAVGWGLLPVRAVRPVDGSGSAGAVHRTGRAD